MKIEKNNWNFNSLREEDQIKKMFIKNDIKIILKNNIDIEFDINRDLNLNTLNYSK
jgi:hypothetical protein